MPRLSFSLLSCSTRDKCASRPQLRTLKNVGAPKYKLLIESHLRQNTPLPTNTLLERAGFADTPGHHRSSRMSFPRRASSGAPCGNIWSYYSRIGNTFERRSAVDFRIPTTYTSILASLSLFPSLPPSLSLSRSSSFSLPFDSLLFFFLRASHDGHRLAEPELRAPVAGERGAHVASVHATFHCVRCPVRAYKAPFTLKIVIPRRRERKRKKKEIHESAERETMRPAEGT